MFLGRGTRIALRIVTGVILAVVYVPLIVVMVNSFNADRTFGWPPSGFTLTFGLAGFVNLTHGAVFMVSAYVATSFSGRGSFVVAVLAAGITGVVLSILVYAVSRLLTTTRPSASTVAPTGDSCGEPSLRNVASTAWELWRTCSRAASRSMRAACRSRRPASSGRAGAQTRRATTSTTGRPASRARCS